MRGGEGGGNRGAKWWQQSQILSPGNDAGDLVAPREVDE